MASGPRRPDGGTAPTRAAAGDSAAAGSAAVGSVWARTPAPKAERITLEAIVAAAVRLADAEGLDAVSVRRVAAELSTRPMSLYAFFSRKDDLVEHMVDQVMGEMILDSLPTDWQEALRAIARHTRAAGSRHPWLMVALSRHPSMGPNALRHMEQSLAAIAGLRLDRRRATSLLLAVDVYTMGSGVMALAERQVRQRDHLTEAQWRASERASLDRLTRTASLPHVAELAAGGLLPRGEDDQAFDDGLSWLLSGFAATLDQPGG